MEVTRPTFAMREVERVRRAQLPAAGATEKGLSFNVDVDARHAARRSAPMRQRLQQVLKNLLANAFKFTEKGGVTLTIRPRDRRRFANPDAGYGRERHRVRRDGHRHRHPARQAAADLRGVPAGGRHDQPQVRRHRLGLSISREIARLLGGEIRVESTPGQGQHVHAVPADRLSSRRSRAGAHGSTAAVAVATLSVPDVSTREMPSSGRADAGWSGGADSPAGEHGDGTRCRTCSDDDRENVEARRSRRAHRRERPPRSRRSCSTWRARRASRRWSRSTAKPALRLAHEFSPTRSRSTSTCPASTAGPCSTG